MEPDPGGPKTCGSGSGSDPEPEHWPWLSVFVVFYEAHSAVSEQNRALPRRQMRTGDGLT
jgi:hypothetical protein